MLKLTEGSTFWRSVACWSLAVAARYWSPPSKDLEQDHPERTNIVKPRIKNMRKAPLAKLMHKRFHLSKFLLALGAHHAPKTEFVNITGQD